MDEKRYLIDNKKLMKEWDFEKNIQFNPYKLSKYSNKAVYWICSKCKHSWKASVSTRSLGHGCPACSGRVATKDKNLEKIDPDLAKEWHPTKNGKLKPTDVLPYSEQKVWWQCRRGHEWKASISNRYQGRNCQQCSYELKTSFPEQCIVFYLSQYYVIESRKKINNWEIDVYLPEYNIGIEYDGIAYHKRLRLEDREKRKEIALKKEKIELIRIKEDYEKQGEDNNIIYFIVDYKYSNLEAALNKLCNKINKITQKEIILDININRDRQKIYKNYIAYEKKNNFATKFPELLEFWNYEKNENLIPEYFSYQSNKSVWWKCKKCDGEWKESVINVAKGNRCPFCSGHRILRGYNDLETLNPILSNEWNYERNGDLLPSMVTCGSNRKVWWKCKNGHEWFETVNRRNKNIICPYCSGRHILVPLKQEQWLKNYNLAKKYFEDNGNLNINAKYITNTGVKLGSWIRTQRVSYKNKSLTDERYKLLSDINMIWELKPGVKKEKYNNEKV